ncbi:MAG: tetratricopeptide repeat protein [Ferruginibacter sp.]
MKNLILTIMLAGTSLCTRAQNADSAKFYYNKGLEEKNAGRFLVASKAFDKAIDFDQSFAPAYLENAYTAQQMRNINLALRHFEKVYKLQPNNIEAIKELTEMYYNFRQYDKAIEFADKCKNCSNASRIKGMSYYRKEDYSEAIKNLEYAIEINPADAEAVYSIGRSYLDMEVYEKAMPYYEKAANMPGANVNWIYELGLLSYNVGAYKKAVTYFTKAAEKGYTQSNDFNENLGYACLSAGEYDRGEALLVGVWKKKPGNKDLLRDMAEMLYQHKQYDRSLMYCQKLMEIDNNDAKALYQAGLCFLKKGPKEKGEKMCDKAIEMDPSLRSLRQKQEMPYGGL